MSLLNGYISKGVKKIGTGKYKYILKSILVFFNSKSYKPEKGGNGFPLSPLQPGLL